MAGTSDGPPDESGQTADSQFLAWLLAGVLAVGAISLFFVHAPQRLKLLGLFALVHGLTSAWILVQLAQTFGIRGRRRIVGLACAVIIGAQLGMAVESHRLRVRQIKEQWTFDSSSLTATQLLGQSPPPDEPEMMDQWRQMREQVEQGQRDRIQQLKAMTTFKAYLRHRFSFLGPLPGPWPSVLWIAELLAAATAGAWLVLLKTKRSGHAVPSTATGRRAE